MGLAWCSQFVGSLNAPDSPMRFQTECAKNWMRQPKRWGHLPFSSKQVIRYDSQNDYVQTKETSYSLITVLYTYDIKVTNERKFCLRVFSRRTDRKRKSAVSSERDIIIKNKQSASATRAS